MQDDFAPGTFQTFFYQTYRGSAGFTAFNHNAVSQALQCCLQRNALDLDQVFFFYSVAGMLQ